MKEFSKAAGDINKLYDMVYSSFYTKVLFAGIELGVFSELEEARRHTEVAEKLALHPENTGYLLDALTSIELLEKNNGLYKNTALSGKYLVRGCDLYIGEYLKANGRIAGFEDIDIAKLVKEGPVSGYRDKKGLEVHDEVYGDYTEMSRISQKAGRAGEIADMVSSLSEFGGFKKMLDLGGGPGLIGIAVVRKHPEMKGVIYDTPHVGKAAWESVKEYGMENRIKVLTGDYTKDSIGEGYDLILAVYTLSIAKHDLDAVIRKIYDALNPKGVFMCISKGLTHEKTRPKELVVGSLPGCLKGCNLRLEQGEISDAVLRIGFKSVYKRTVSMLMGEADVDIARK